MKIEKHLKRLETLSLSQKLAISRASLPYYAEEFIKLENGQKFSFKNHEYLFEIYAEHHPDIRIQKAAQMGITTWAFIKSIWGCLNTLPLGIMYFFPTQHDVSDFSKGRISAFMKYNRSIMFQDDQDINNVGLKRIGKSMMYFRGMQSDIGVKAVPADGLVFDEIDEADPYKREMALKRIDHSDYKWKMELSNPTIENYGINRSFQETDMRYWYIKCEHCGKWNSLDKEFPNCLKYVKADDKVIRICKKCKKELNLRGQGKWVADSPSIKDKRGYFISQLYSNYVDPKTIYDEHNNKRGYELESFYRLRLGKAYTLAENRIKKQAILDLESTEEISLQQDDRCFMGVDQGKGLHIVILKKKAKTVLQTLMELTNFEDLDNVMKNNRVEKCVIDALPETREAKKFRDRNRGKVYLNYYDKNRKGKYKWDEKEKQVNVNRTESMDDSQALLTDPDLIINKGLKDLDKFAEHCSNIVRKIEEDTNTGSKRYVWVKTAPDHYRHALNYAKIAMDKLKGQLRIR
jgi:hypothetical protein